MVIFYNEHFKCIIIGIMIVVKLTILPMALMIVKSKIHTVKNANDATKRNENAWGTRSIVLVLVLVSF